ncbi:hypothetical protein ACETRY_10625 [Cronobacter malonaticus]|uniref:tail fiber/spike domain-containing protein n=2 Tax=Cronobacter malonaticus TaxID=413503 RepID=UPI0038653851
MATQPTNLPVPSESPRDLKFNAGKIDEFVTSLVTTYIDRFGNEHYTIEGLNQLARQAISAFGWIPAGTFQAGATISLPNQILKDTSSGEYYRWDGSLPKIVPAGSTPASTGGTGVGAWISVGDSALRSMLAATTGAGLVGYSASVTYPAGTVGEALGPYKATGGTRKISREDRAALMGRNIADFTPFGTDAGSAANAAIAQVLSEADPAHPDVAGGTINMTHGRHVSSTSINVNIIPGIGGYGISLKGEGITATHLDLSESPAVDGIASDTDGAIYGHHRDFTVWKGRRGLSMGQATRMEFSHIRSVQPNGDAFYMGNVFMDHIHNLEGSNGKSHGLNFAPTYNQGSTTQLFTKTSLSVHTNYMRGFSGSGFKWGNTYYSHSSANGSDGNGQWGHVYDGNIAAMAVTADGSETNQRSGFRIEALSSDINIRGLSFRNIYAYGNNRSNAGHPNLLSIATANGGVAYASLEGAVSIPNGPGSTTQDVIVNGAGAHLYLKGDCILPNGFSSTNNGYIHFQQVPIITNKTVPLSSATAICSLQSTQGKLARYAGELSIVVRSTHPSNENGNISYYRLGITKHDAGGSTLLVKVIATGGYADTTPGVGATSWPVFTWSLNTTTNNLVATPVANVGGVEFWFEIVASGQIVASTI